MWLLITGRQETSHDGAGSRTCRGEGRAFRIVSAILTCMCSSRLPSRLSLCDHTITQVSRFFIAPLCCVGQKLSTNVSPDEISRDLTRFVNGVRCNDKLLITVLRLFVIVSLPVSVSDFPSPRCCCSPKLCLISFGESKELNVGNVCP